MSVLSSFTNLPIINKVAKIYNTYIGSNQSNTTPKGTPTSTGESDPVLGSADPEPLYHDYNAGTNIPLRNIKKNIALDVAIATNPQVKTGLKNFAYDGAGTLKGIKVLSAVNKDKTQLVVDRFIKRTKLKKYLGEYFRRCLLYGNAYLQHEIQRVSSSEAQINKLFWMPVYGMIRNSDELDRFPVLDAAFQQEDVSLGVIRKTNPVAKFPFWSINHLRMFNVEGEPYGFSMIEGLLASGANVRFVDLLVQLYFQRSYSTVTDIHVLAGPDGKTAANPTTVSDHLNFVSKVLRRVLHGKGPARDIVIPSGSVNRLASDPNTDKIGDIEFLSGYNLSEVHQSPQMISDDQFANVGVLVEKFRQFNNRQENHLRMFTAELDPSLQFELALHGIDPNDCEWEYVIDQLYLLQDLIAINKEARADLSLNQITEETRLKIGSMLYRVNAETEQEKLKAQKEANRITASNQSDDTRKIVEQQLNNKDLSPRDITLKPVDPAEAESDQIN